MGRRRIGLLLWLLAAAALWFFEDNTGTRTVLAASVGIPVTSVACALWTARHCTVSLRMPDSCMAGEGIRILCSRRGPWTRFFCCIGGSVALRNGLTGEGILLPLDRSIPLTPLHAGMLEARLSAVRVSDWLGVIRVPVNAQECTVMRVLPTLFDVDIRLDSVREIRQPAQMPLPRAGHSDISDIRAYRPGDPLRQIHWKLTEKLDQPLVRESPAALDAPVLLLLESHCARGTAGRDIHCCVQAFLSTAWAMCQQRRSCRAAGVGADGLFILDIASTADFEVLCDAVLSSRISSDVQCVACACAAQCPEDGAYHTFLFCPSGETDAASLTDGRALTLVLPETTGCTGAAFLALHLSADQPVLEG